MAEHGLRLCPVSLSYLLWARPIIANRIKPKRTPRNDVFNSDQTFCTLVGYFSLASELIYFSELNQGDVLARVLTVCIFLILRVWVGRSPRSFSNELGRIGLAVLIGLLTLGYNQTNSLRILQTWNRNRTDPKQNELQSVSCWAGSVRCQFWFIVCVTSLYVPTILSVDGNSI